MGSNPGYLLKSFLLYQYLYQILQKKYLVILFRKIWSLEVKLWLQPGKHLSYYLITYFASVFTSYVEWDLENSWMICCSLLRQLVMYLVWFALLHGQSISTKVLRWELFMKQNWNPTIFNIIRLVTGLVGQTAHQPSVWCSKHYFFS